MIVDRLSNAPLYERLNPLFAAGFEFLSRPGTSSLTDGRHPIDGDRVFAIVSRNQGRGRVDSMLEAHRRYIDIQFVVAGQDCIGWMPRADCQRVSQAYDPETDLEFFYDRPDTWLAAPAQVFAIFFPDDAHAPLGTEGAVHKVVVKVAVGRGER